MRRDEYEVMEAFCRADNALGLRAQQLAARHRGMMPGGGLAQDAIYTELLRRASMLWSQLPRTLRAAIARPDHE